MTSHELILGWRHQYPVSEIVIINMECLPRPEGRGLARERRIKSSESQGWPSEIDDWWATFDRAMKSQVPEMACRFAVGQIS